MEVKFFTIVTSLLCLVDLIRGQRIAEESLGRSCRSPRGQFAHETFCHYYYNCWDGRATLEQCPGELLFNSINSRCDYPEAVNCGPRIRNPAPYVSGGLCLKEWGVFPDQTDCRAFYECAHGRAFRKVCPVYTAFDERYLVCVHAYNVDCRGRGGVYGPLTSGPIYALDKAATQGGSGRVTAVGPVGPVIGGGPGPDREKQYERPVSPEATFRCPQPRGLYGYALDCSRFWLCREYRPSLLKCPTSQLFDMASLTCTRPDKAQCSTLSSRS